MVSRKTRTLPRSLSRSPLRRREPSRRAKTGRKKTVIRARPRRPRRRAIQMTGIWLAMSSRNSEATTAMRKRPMMPVNRSTRAGAEPCGLEREAQGQPVGVDTPEDVSDLAEGCLGGQDQDEYGQADGQLEQKEESIFSVGHFNQRFFTINSCSCICRIVAEAFP